MSILAEKLASETGVASVIISIALMLFCGFAMTRVTKKLHLPDVTAYIVTGILLGPECLQLVPQTVNNGMDFIADIALAFISFGVGEFFRMDMLKKSGFRTILITLAEAISASVLVFILTYFILHLSLPFSIVLAALASATAPTSTMMTVRQTHAKGEFVDTLLQVIALDDVLSLLVFSVALSIAMSIMTGESASLQNLLQPIFINITVMALGFVFGFVLKLLLAQHTTDNRLIVSIAMLFAFCGICALLDISPLLGCMTMGMAYINLSGDDKLFKQLSYFSPPILLLFFVRSGLNVQLSALVQTGSSDIGAPLIVIAVSFCAVRMIGKYIGSFLGCRFTEKSPTIQRLLGLALIPQASVAIGLAALGARTLGGTAGQDLQTVVLASSVLGELIGPACADLALHRSGCIPTTLEDLTTDPTPQQAKNDCEALIARIAEIQKTLPEHNMRVPSEEEIAFTQAAMEKWEITDYRQRGRLSRRR